MKIEMRALDRIRPYEANPRVNEHAVEAVARSIREFGFRQPIVVDKAGVIVVGHTRWKAAQALGLKKVPVHVAGDLSAEQARAYRIADNRLQDLAEWDEALLAQELTALKDLDSDLSILGFTDDELANLLRTDDGGQTDPNAVPEPPPKAISRRGEVYLLGNHRLMCGDSTKAADVERLMKGEKAALYATDPPYGVGYGELIQDSLNRTRKWDSLQNDEIAGEKTQDFLELTFKAWLPHLEENAAWYLWHAQKVQGYFTAAAAAAGVLYHRQIVWVKPQMILGRGHFHWRHELCLYGWRKGHEARMPPERNITSVWEFKRDANVDYQHPTQKPIECFAFPMKYSTLVGGLCAEPFSGSGTQFIAAEQLGRRCYGMEIEPRYVDVARRRWAEFVHGEGCDWAALAPAEEIGRAPSGTGRRAGGRRPSRRGRR